VLQAHDFRDAKIRWGLCVLNSCGSKVKVNPLGRTKYGWATPEWLSVCSVEGMLLLRHQAISKCACQNNNNIIKLPRLWKTVACSTWRCSMLWMQAHSRAKAHSCTASRRWRTTTLGYHAQSCKADDRSEWASLEVHEAKETIVLGTKLVLLSSLTDTFPSFWFTTSAFRVPTMRMPLSLLLFGSLKLLHRGCGLAWALACMILYSNRTSRRIFFSPRWDGWDVDNYMTT